MEEKTDDWDDGDGDNIDDLLDDRGDGAVRVFSSVSCCDGVVFCFLSSSSSSVAISSWGLGTVDGSAFGVVFCLDDPFSSSFC